MKDRREEIIALSDEIIEDIEQSKLPLHKICLKAQRLAKLSGDTIYYKAFRYEKTGYPKNIRSTGEVFEIARLARRFISKTNSIDGQSIEYTYLREREYTRYMESLNRTNRLRCISLLALLRERLEQRKDFIFDYAVNKNIEMKFGNNLESISNSLIKRSAGKISQYIPDGTKKIASCIKNIKSNDPEDWANTTTTIRRILEKLAKKIEPDNKEKYHKILKKYINEEYKDACEIHMKFIVEDANKGTHTEATREEAEKLLLHVCLFLDEIDWDKVDNKINALPAKDTIPNYKVRTKDSGNNNPHPPRDNVL